MKSLIKIFFITIPLVLWTCKKDTPRPPSNVGHGYGCASGGYHFNEENKKLKFKKDTYWVYVDSVSLSVDSTWIDSILFDGIYYLNNACNNFYEEYKFRVKSSQSTKVDSFLLYAYKVYRNMGNSPNFYKSVVYSAPSFTSDLHGYTNGDTLSLKDSVFIYDMYYKQVVISNIKADVNEGNLKTVYYVNGDEGFLRKDVFNPDGTLKSRKLLKNKNILR